MRDHDPLVITNFRGTFDRGDDDVCPEGFFVGSQNIRFTQNGIATRYGMRKSITIGSVARIEIYKRIGEAQRLIILDTAGKLYDSTNLLTPILNIAAMIDFSMVTMFNRAYITPHNRITGLPGEKVYVYEGSGVAAPAAGQGPSNVLVAVESGVAGHIETGAHAFAVAFELSTGFITKPGGFTSLISTGGLSVDLSNIEIGGSKVVARHILATKTIKDFNGNYNDQTYYLAKRIPDNTATTTNISFYDADLQSDATFLLEQMTTIPAGVGITAFKGKLVVWGENLYPAIARVSTTGQPESFNEVEGFLTVNPGVGGGLKNCWEYRDSLLLQKSQQTYVTSDNGSPAAYWSVNNIDMSVGAECHSVAKSLDFGENVGDRVFTADKSGIRPFSGTFSAEQADVITYNVDDIWARINSAAFNTVELVIDPLNYLIYAAIPLDTATHPNAILFGDYSEGLNSTEVRWTTWIFPYDIGSIVVDLENEISVFKMGSRLGNIYQIDPTLKLDDGLAINQWVEFPYLPVGPDDNSINHYTGIRLRIKGEGNLNINISGPDRVDTLIAAQPTLLPAPGKTVFQGFNFTSEHCAVKLSLISANEWFVLTKFIVYYTLVWEDRPIG
jgi:hypothetical protein